MRIARKPSPLARRDSLTFRSGSGGPLRRQRAAVACALGATASLGAVALYQTGLLTAGKAGVDTLAGLYLFGEQLVKHRTVCPWCTAAAAAHLATVALTAPDALAAVRPPTLG